MFLTWRWWSLTINFPHFCRPQQMLCKAYDALELIYEPHLPFSYSSPHYSYSLLTTLNLLTPIPSSEWYAKRDFVLSDMPYHFYLSSVLPAITRSQALCIYNLFTFFVITVFCFKILLSTLPPFKLLFSPCFLPFSFHCMSQISSTATL